jgi:DNA-binding GntR family transcriptional regulator
MAASPRLPFSEKALLLCYGSQVEKTATVLIRKIRDAILDDIFKPGDWLPELDLAKRFEVSRSPIREALQAFEKEGTVITEPYKGAVVKSLLPEEVLDIAELRLAVITLAAKAAYRHLSPAAFDLLIVGVLCPVQLQCW